MVSLLCDMFKDCKCFLGRGFLCNWKNWSSFLLNNRGFRKKVRLIKRHRIFRDKTWRKKIWLFLKGYLKEGVNEEELSKCYQDRYEEELEDKRERYDIDVQLDLSKTDEEELNKKESSILLE